MAQKIEQQTPAIEGLKVLTPTDVPEWVDCFVSKRQIRGEDARLVEYQAGKDVWVHKRFLGESTAPVEEEELGWEYEYEEEAAPAPAAAAEPAEPAEPTA